MRRFVLLLLLTVTWIDHSYAQAKIESSEIVHFVQTADGEPRLCGIDFTILFSDYVTSSAGKLAATRGSLNFTEDKGNLGLFLKVMGLDFTGGPAQPPTKFVVSNASLTAGETTYAANQVPCEENTSFCGAYWLPSSGEIYQKMSSERAVTLNFNRTMGSLDFQIPIPAKGTPDDAKNELAYDACMKTMISRTLSKAR